MQITARKHRFPMLNVKYAAVALGIVGALVAGTIIYTLTEDDSHSTQPIAAAPVQSFEQMADENSLGGSPAIAESIGREDLLPTLREGFNSSSTGDNFVGASPKARGGSSATTNDDAKAYYNPASGEGIIGGNEGADPYTTRDDLLAFHNPAGGEGLIAGNQGADRSILAPQFRSYEDMLFAEHNGILDITLSARAAGAGMLQEEFTEQNPGANWSTQTHQRQTPRANGHLIP